MMPRRITDPADELFDILNDDGTPTGAIKRRADVHRDGDWHRAFHLWLFASGESGEDLVLFQLRAAGKDTWPNRFDVAVGGHFRTGETIEDVVREIDEEIGIQPEISELTYAGRRQALSDGPDWHDRELQDVYLLAFPGDFPDFAPNSTELAGLVKLRIADLIRLFEGEQETVPGSRATVEGDRALGEWHTAALARSDFVPVRDNYMVRGALAGRALLHGDSVISIEPR